MKRKELIQNPVTFHHVIDLNNKGVLATGKQRKRKESSDSESAERTGEYASEQRE